MVEENIKEEQKYDMVDNAKMVAERLERANRETRENLERLERLETRRILGGQAAVTEEPKKVAESPAEYAKRMLRGGQ